MKNSLISHILFNFYPRELFQNSQIFTLSIHNINKSFNTFFIQLIDAMNSISISENAVCEAKVLSTAVMFKIDIN